jgi:hypothetical protein
MTSATRTSFPHVRRALLALADSTAGRGSSRTPSAICCSCSP